MEDKLKLIKGQFKDYFGGLEYLNQPIENFVETHFRVLSPEEFERWLNADDDSEFDESYIYAVEGEKYDEEMVEDMAELLIEEYNLLDIKGWLNGEYKRSNGKDSLVEDIRDTVDYPVTAPKVKKAIKSVIETQYKGQKFCDWSEFVKEVCSQLY